MNYIFEPSMPHNFNHFVSLFVVLMSVFFLFCFGRLLLSNMIPYGSRMENICAQAFAKTCCQCMVRISLFVLSLLPSVHWRRRRRYILCITINWIAKAYDCNWYCGFCWCFLFIYFDSETGK